MRKLKLEALEVESFETMPAMQDTRGTVQGHRPNTDGCPIVIGPGTNRVSECIICIPPTQDLRCQTIGPNFCPDTEWLDCTYTCWYTRNGANSCDICWISDACTVEAG